MSEKSPQDEKLIRKFMKQSLNKEEHKLFDQKMEKEHFANQVAEESVRLSSRSRFRSELKIIHTEVIDSSSSWPKQIALLAASILLLSLAIAYYYTTQDTPKRPVDIAFATYFEPYPNLFSQRGNLTPKDQKIQNVLTAYDEKDYEKTILLFEALSKAEIATASHLPFYYAVSLLAEEKAARAIPLFQEILSGTSPALKSETNWYLALAHIQMEQKEKAREILLKIESDTTAYNTKSARELLETLKD